MQMVIILSVGGSSKELGTLLAASGDEFKLGNDKIFILVSSKSMDSGVGFSGAMVGSSGANKGSMVVGLTLDAGFLPGANGFPDNHTKGLLVGVACLMGVFEACG